jgi:hypothetical protein
MEKTDLKAPWARSGFDGVAASTQSRGPARLVARFWREDPRPGGGAGPTFRDDAQRSLATVCDLRALKTACAAAPAGWHHTVQGTGTRLIGTNAADPQISTKTLWNAPRRRGTKPLASRGWPAAAVVGAVPGWLLRFRKPRTIAHATSYGGGWGGTERCCCRGGVRARAAAPICKRRTKAHATSCGGDWGRAERCRRRGGVRARAAASIGKPRTTAHTTSCGGGWGGTERVAAGAGSVSGRTASLRKPRTRPRTTSCGGGWGGTERCRCRGGGRAWAATLIREARTKAHATSCGGGRGGIER